MSMKDHNASVLGIREVENRDLCRIAELCNQSLDRKETTFGLASVTAEDLRRELLMFKEQGYGSFLYEDHSGQIVALAALTRHTDRNVYRTIAEANVLVDPSVRNQGIGARMIHLLVEKARLVPFSSLLMMTRGEAYLASWLEELGFVFRGSLKGLLQPGATDSFDLKIYQMQLSTHYTVENACHDHGGSDS